MSQEECFFVVVFFFYNSFMNVFKNVFLVLVNKGKHHVFNIILSKILRRPFVSLCLKRVKKKKIKEDRETKIKTK